MKISIVMTSYNGQVYILEQLDSIRQQTRRPDEVLIFDDGSTDATVSLTQTFIEEHRLQGWRVARNERNLGWRRNFMQGFAKATGDVIFCADQDDIWEASKIEKMAAVMAERPEIEILACSIAPFWEEKGQDRGLTAHHLADYGAERVSKVEFDPLWLEPRRPGCTLCFRRSILPQIERIWFDTCAHDLALWSYGAAKGTLYILNEKLVRYRRHAGVSTPSNRKTAEVRAGLMHTYHTLAGNVLRQKTALGIADEVAREIEKLDRFYCKRYQAITKRDLPALLSLLISMGQYPKPASWAADVIASFR